MSSALSPQMRHVHEALSAAGSGTPREQGGQWRAKCPAHDDHQASLMVAEGHKKVVFNCHAGCSYEAIVEALDLDPLSVYADQPTSLDDADRWMPDGKEAIAVYRYTDEQGKLLFGVSRSADKDFRQWRPDPSKKHGRAWSGVSQVRKVPYHLPALLAGIAAGRRVWIVEGEKDVHALEGKGEVATTNPGGAGKPIGGYLDFFKGAVEVIVVADLDGPDKKYAGEAHAAAWGVALAKSGINTRIVVAAEGKDAGDHLTANRSIEDFQPIEAGRPGFTSFDSFIRTPPSPPGEAPAVVPMRPRLHDDARYGLAWQIVAEFDPNTEADPVGVLAVTLAAFGSMVGRRPHFHAGDEQPARIWPLLIGRTSTGRKNTCWTTVKKLFDKAESDWFTRRVKTGLSSGEGLINQVRDYTEDELDAAVKDGKVLPEIDKRLFVIEAEFAKVLEVGSRQGNSLSYNIRNAYDGDPLGTITMNPMAARDHHITILGMVTPDELQRKLTEGEQANGFANRFLFIAVKRSKKLPFPKRPDPERIEDLAGKLAAALQFSDTVWAMTFDEAAAKLYADTYLDMNDDDDEGGENLVEVLTARASTHVVRLAVAYALLDRSKIIREPHLRAALALWRYAAASAAMAFGDATGDKLADKLLAAIRQAGIAGLDRSAMHGVVSGNVKAALIDRALRDLEQKWNLVVTETEKTGQRGRPKMLAYAVEHAPEHLRPTPPQKGGARIHEDNEDNQEVGEAAGQQPAGPAPKPPPSASGDEEIPSVGRVRIACLGDCLTARYAAPAEVGQPCGKCGGKTVFYAEEVG